MEVLPSKPDDMPAAAGRSAQSSAIAVVMLSITVAIVFAMVRLPYMNDPKHFFVRGPRWPVLHAFLNSFAVQLFMGSTIAVPVSKGMQSLFIIQMLIAFILASALFVTLAAHLDTLVAAAARTD